MVPFYYQLPLFFESPFVHRVDRLSVAVQDKYKNSQQIQMLPLPDNAPIEIPRMILIWDDLRLEFFPMRADVKGEKFENVMALGSSLINLLWTRFPTTIVRVGFIKHFFVKNITVPQNLFKDDIIKKSGDEEIFDISFNINTRYKHDEYMMNNIQDVRAGQQLKDEVLSSGVIILRDINTIQEEKYSFTAEWVNNFYIYANKKADQMIVELGGKP